jgi:hypothetical protein
MTAELDEIYQGDSYSAVFVWSKPSDDNPNVSVAANPSAATFSIVRARDGQAVALADNTADVNGNETACRTSSGVLNRSGNYTLYCTAVFPDESTLTRSRAFRVKAKI